MPETWTKTATIHVNSGSYDYTEDEYVQIDEANEVVEDLEEKLKEVEEERDTMSETLEQTQQQLERITQDRDALIEERTGLQLKVEDQDARIAQLMTRIKQLQDQMPNVEYLDWVINGQEFLQDQEYSSNADIPARHLAAIRELYRLDDVQELWIRCRVNPEDPETKIADAAVFLLSDSNIGRLFTRDFLKLVQTPPVAHSFYLVTEIHEVERLMKEIGLNMSDYSPSFNSFFVVEWEA